MNLIGILKTNKGIVEVHHTGYPFNTVSLKYETKQWSPSMECEHTMVCDILEDAKNYITKYFGYEVKSLKVNAYL